MSVSLSSDTAIVGAYGNHISGGAAYVFTRSGAIWTQEDKLTCDENTNTSGFGLSVAVSGDTALVGLLGSDNNASYIFTRTGTVWSRQATLVGSDAGNLLDFSVALAGGTAIIGGVENPYISGGSPGRAYVFVRSGDSWSQEARLFGDQPPTGGSLGASVSISGETVLIGAPNDATPSGESVGAAYAFVRQGSNWIQQGRLTASDGEALDAFGSAVAIKGDTAVIGAPRAGMAQVFTPPTLGKAYVFVRNGVIWSQQAKLVPLDGTLGDHFGTSVSLSYQTALVGASGDGSSPGQAYIFIQTNGLWTQQAKLVPNIPTVGEEFGSACALFDNTAIVGAPALPYSAIPGTAFAFIRLGTTWVQEDTLQPTDGAAGDLFGVAVALSGETALIGAPGANSSTGTETGSAYVFVRSGNAWVQQATLRAVEQHTLAHFGAAVDIDGQTALVASPSDTIASAFDAGTVHVFTRNAITWNPEVKLTAGVDVSSSDAFGASVALGGNTAVVGSPGDATAGGGSSYIFLVAELPTLIQQPISRTILPAASATFSVAATGYEPLHYQWRHNNLEIPNATNPNYVTPPASVNNSGGYDVEGIYDVVVSNIGGVATSAPATLLVDDLSDRSRNAAASLPGEGFVFVTLTPPSISPLSGWHFVGEQLWRESGVLVPGVAAGDHDIDFRPVPGYVQPPRTRLNVLSNQLAQLTGDYYQGTAGTPGSITVQLIPQNLPGAQWQLHGEALWHNSNETVSNLVSGEYLIQFKPVTTNPPDPLRITPQPISVRLSSGNSPLFTAEYAELERTTNNPTIATVLNSFDTAIADPTLPYGYVGQLRSDVGSGTGFVVKPRVVATAAHAVYDATNEAFKTGLQWLFQRQSFYPGQISGSYEPKPQVPRGVLILDGYASAAGASGESSSASRNLDVAALYFFEDAGWGGYSGYLASDNASGNEFLLSSELQKILVGYPVDGIDPINQGKMHATPPITDAFLHDPTGTDPSGNAYQLYKTTSIASSGGASGGPLCIKLDDGNYYPAAVYLGGNGESV